MNKISALHASLKSMDPYPYYVKWRKHTVAFLRASPIPKVAAGILLIVASGCMVDSIVKDAGSQFRARSAAPTPTPSILALSYADALSLRFAK